MPSLDESVKTSLKENRFKKKAGEYAKVCLNIQNILSRRRKLPFFTALAFILLGSGLGEMSQHYGTWAAWHEGAEPKGASEFLDMQVVEGDFPTAEPELSHKASEVPGWKKLEESASDAASGEKAADNPAPDRLNLAYLYPEDVDTEDALNSCAGLVFQELSALDSKWLAELYELAGTKPARMAAQLGKGADAVMGAYNPKDDSHDPKKPDTWKINDWKQIHVSFVDGNGKKASSFSNAREILAMASVYTYYDDPADAEAFEDYAKQLWKASHSYSVGMGERYYCDGCMDEEDKEEDGTAAAENQEVQKAQETTGQGEIGTDRQGEPTGPASASDIPVPLPDAKETGANGTEEIMESFGETEEALGIGEAVQSALEALSSDRESALMPGDCPGHIDLYIRVRLLGLEGKNNLYAKDKQGNQGKEGPQSIWEGWTEEKRSYVDTIYRQDWFKDYGIDLSEISFGTSLSQQQIKEYMDKLPGNLSQTRKNIISFALSSIGKVPYYWGGKASCAGYEGNDFGSFVPADTKGRVLKGLDCSGWIHWVYWSAAGKKLNAASTSGLIHCGKEIRRSELKPGDIVVHTGEDAHVVMFLSWAANGQMNVIHESSGPINNVTVTTMDAPWPYYRKLVE